MADDSVHSEGIRLQAERVVRAYSAMRDRAKTMESGDFPVAEIGELFQQVRLLDGWLQPIAESEEDGADRLEVLKVAGGPFEGASTCIDQAKALASLISSDESDDTESMKLAASMVYGLMNDAQHWLNNLWGSTWR
jgi:hypothetical protein